MEIVLVIGAAVACLAFAVALMFLRPAPPVKLPAVAQQTSAQSRGAPLPKCVAFFDVETTGLADKDRIVTLAGVKLLDTGSLSAGKVELEYLYLIFDPGRKSHPRAEAIHGYSDWILRHQDGFDVYAETIESFFDSADLLVAHNVEFDVSFYNREMLRVGRSPTTKPICCTMKSYRERNFTGSASLSAICQRIGVVRATNVHGALEDAWLAMRVYLWLNNRAFSGELPPEFRGDPSNLKQVPQLSVGPMPRRQRKRISTEGDGVVVSTSPPLQPPVLQ
jgi:DNA polymerase-3 subunit epsilon